MPNVLVAYATSEGQTGRIANTLAEHIRGIGPNVDVLELVDRNTQTDVGRYDAVIIAASVHAGKHQDNVLRFSRKHKAELASMPTAFLSVSLSAASTEDAGHLRAGEQVEDFLKKTGWNPTAVMTIGGAIRYSGFTLLWRWILRVSQRLFRKEFRRQGWPDLTLDQEFTDWDAVRRFGQQFCNKL